MSAEGKGPQVAKGILKVFLILLLIFLLLPFVPLRPFVVEMPFRVLFGWAIHAWKALPPLFGKWQEAVLPLGCLGMGAVIAHRFVRRWVQEKFPKRSWRIKHTAAVLSLLLLGSGAAIAASGVVHQMFWLGSENLTKSNRRASLTMAVNNGRQLMLYLMEYVVERGRYPHTWEELELPSGLIWVDVGDGKAPEPFMLLRPGSAEVALSEPVILSPLLENGKKVVVGYSDTSVMTIRVEKLAKLLNESQVKEGR